MDRRFSIKHNNYHYLAAFISVAAVFVLTFVISFLASSILASVSESNATTTRVTLGNNYYVEVTASDIDLSLSTTPGGALAVAESNVVTKTNCNGYKLYLSSANTSPTVPIMNPHTHVVENVPTNSLILDGSSTTSGDWLPATPGEFTAAAGGPQAFRDSSHVNTNTWGFAVPSGSTGLPASAGAFDATYGTTAGGDVNYANKFAKVPLYTSPALIQSTSTADETGVDLDVYYGVYANMDNTAGDYSANVLYTVAAESPDVPASVSPSTTTALGGGDSLTITTPIFTSMPLTASDINVTVGTASCPVTSITTTSSGNPDVLKITCSAPALSINTYNVTAAIPKLGQSFTITNGLTYSLGGTSITSISPNSMDEGDASSLATDIVINTDITATGLTASDLALTIGSTTIPSSGLSLSYTDNKLAAIINHTDASTITALESLTADTYDVNLNVKGVTVTEADEFTVEAAIPAFWTITTMQQMTAEVCNSVYTPNNGTGDNITLVDNAYDYYTTYGVSADGTRYVPQRTLYDIRGADGTGTSANPVTSGSNAKTYTIRKLADGNCWMSEELYLPLAVGTPVEASYNDGATFIYTPTTNYASIGANTKTYTWDNTERWYYNWFAATAEAHTYMDTKEGNIDVNGSICPKGWKLPYGYVASSAVSWGALTNAYNVTINGDQAHTELGLSLGAAPISLPLAGTYNYAGYYNGGTVGSFWSSTGSVYNAGGFTAFSLNISLDSYGTAYWVNPKRNADYRTSYGFNVRCLASPLAH